MFYFLVDVLNLLSFWTQISEVIRVSEGTCISLFWGFIRWFNHPRPGISHETHHWNHGVSDEEPRTAVVWLLALRTVRAYRSRFKCWQKSWRALGTQWSSCGAGLNLWNTFWWINIAMENHHVSWENSLFLLPFSIAMLN